MKKEMSCNCISEIGDRLKTENLRLSPKHMGFRMPDFTLSLYFALEWIDKANAPAGKKNRSPNMFLSYCPFCGVKIEQKTEPQDERCEHGVSKNIPSIQCAACEGIRDTQPK